MEKPVLADPVPIIGRQYCEPNSLDFGIVRNVLRITNGNFDVSDIKGNIMFKVKGVLHSLRDRRRILDAAENPIVTLQKKIMSAHHRWQVFRGDSTDDSNLIFSIKRTSVIQFRAKLDVFLANNTTEDICDFKVKGSLLKRSCVVYAGESSTIVAKMHKKVTAKSVLLGKDNFMVRVYPNIDYAFIVALIVILDEINSEDIYKKTKNTMKIHKFVTNVYV